MRHVLALLLGSALAACGASTPRPVDPSREVVTMEEMRIVASSGGEGDLVLEAYDASQLFERGNAALQRGECREAVTRYYDRLVREFPSSRFVAPALYNAGLCLHELGALSDAVPYYEGVLERAPQTRDGRHATLQLAQALLGLERWEAALRVAERGLLREDLTEPERLEGLARRAQALLGLARFEDAERQARDALTYHRALDRRGIAVEAYFPATANYVLAETMRMRSEAMELPAGTAEQQHAVLDQRARLVLDAQREYFNTIRHTNAEWAAAAGYRIGAMYDQLWQALMRAPIPPPDPGLDRSVVPIYEAEYRAELARHVRPLLRHAIRYWELTLMMVERTGVRTEWAERTRADLERMRELLLEQTDPVVAPEPAPAAAAAGSGA